MAEGRISWRPTRIRRFVKAIESSACTAVVETDAGPGYLKALGGPEGPHTLACEWVGTQLAKWFDLATFDFALLEVSEVDEIPFYNGDKAQRGPAFISRAERGEPWSGKSEQLSSLFNPEDLGRLVVFDTWTLNCDRFSWPIGGKIGRPRVRRNNVFLSEEAPAGQFIVKAMDHTHCFTCGRELTKTLCQIDRIKDPRVFGLFPEFRPFVERYRRQIARASRDLERIDKPTVRRMTRSIPREWDVSKEAQEALVNLVVSRAAYVAETIFDKIWPQRELGFSDPDATEKPL